MKEKVALFVTVLCIIAMSEFSQDSRDERKAISIRDLNSMDVIGVCGVPLGNVVEIQAIIVSGDSLRMKAYAGHYLLRTLSVNGVDLETPGVVSRFSVLPMIETQLASDPYELYELMHQRKAQRLSSDEIKVMEEAYVGQRVRLLVYETGGFSGIPDGLPDNFPVWSAPRFGFESSLVVVKQFD